MSLCSLQWQNLPYLNSKSAVNPSNRFITASFLGIGQSSLHTDLKKFKPFPVASIFLPSDNPMNFGIIDLLIEYLSCQSLDSSFTLGLAAMKNSVNGSSNIPSKIHLRIMLYIGLHTVVNKVWTVAESIGSPWCKKPYIAEIRAPPLNLEYNVDHVNIENNCSSLRRVTISFVKNITNIPSTSFDYSSQKFHSFHWLHGIDRKLMQR